MNKSCVKKGLKKNFLISLTGYYSGFNMDNLVGFSFGKAEICVTHCGYRTIMWKIEKKISTKKVARKKVVIF